MISRSVAVKRAPKLKEYIKLNRVGIKNIYSVCIIDGNSKITRQMIHLKHGIK